jgi:hypothetical protein
MMPFTGFLLFLGMMTLVFFGPEWFVKLTVKSKRKPKQLKKLVRGEYGSRIVRLSGRRTVAL